MEKTKHTLPFPKTIRASWMAVALLLVVLALAACGGAPAAPAGST